MNRIEIRGTGVTTSALGFGCAGLTSLNDRRKALRLLHASFEAGITHFDVARLYGFGHAESILGEFLAGRRDHVTLTTKFGLEPPTGIVGGNARLVSVARSIVRQIPAVGRLIRKRATKMVATGAFSPQAAARSLEKSLTELRTDRVDFLLLHEGTLADARSDALLGFLADQKARGTVRHIGVASAADKLGDDLSRFPAQHRLFQFENNVLERRLQALQVPSNVGVITHSVLRPLNVLLSLVTQRVALTRLWSDRLDVDLSAPTALARLLISWAATQNPAGVVLFSTTRLDKVRDNSVSLVDEPPGAPRVELFGEFVKQLSSACNAAGDASGNPCELPS